MHRLNAQELCLLVQRGVTPHAGLRAGTIEASTLRPGKFDWIDRARKEADLAAVPGDGAGLLTCYFYN
jgi:hypothetical protein